VAENSRPRQKATDLHLGLHPSLQSAIQFEKDRIADDDGDIALFGAYHLTESLSLRSRRAALDAKRDGALRRRYGISCQEMGNDCGTEAFNVAESTSAATRGPRRTLATV